MTDCYFRDLFSLEWKNSQFRKETYKFIISKRFIYNNYWFFFFSKRSNFPLFRDSVFKMRYEEKKNTKNFYKLTVPIRMLTCNRNKIIVKNIINKIDQTYRTINLYLYKIYFEIVKFENNLKNYPIFLSNK